MIDVAFDLGSGGLSDDLGSLRTSEDFRTQAVSSTSVLLGSLAKHHGCQSTNISSGNQPTVASPHITSKEPSSMVDGSVINIESRMNLGCRLVQAIPEALI